jgi:hypothetical protein
MYDSQILQDEIILDYLGPQTSFPNQCLGTMFRDTDTKARYQKHSSVVYFHVFLQADMVVPVVDKVDGDGNATATRLDKLVICVLDAKSVENLGSCAAPAAESWALHEEPIVAPREQIAWFPHSSVQ